MLISMKRPFYLSRAENMLFLLLVAFAIGVGMSMIWTFFTKQTDGVILSHIKTMISTILTFGVPSIIFWHLKCGDNIYRGLHINTAPRWRAVVYSIVAVFVAMPAIGYVNKFVGDFTLRYLPDDLSTSLTTEANAHIELIQSMIGDGSLAMLPVSIIVLGIIPALCEEMFFRGTLQRVLTRIWHRPVLAIVITSVVFALLHADYLNWAGIFMCSIIMGLLYFYTSSLWISIIFHAVWNTWNITLMYLEVHYPTNDMVGDGRAISPIMAALSIFITWSVIKTCRSVQYMERNLHIHLK